MATTVKANVRVIGGGQVRDTATGAFQPAVFGADVLPSATLTLTTGTGNQQVNQWYCARRTLAGTTFDLLDLSGGLTNGLGQTVTLTKLKYVRLSVVSPDGTKALRIGPQNQAAAAQLWFGGTGATVYDTVYETVEHRMTYAGWTITGTTADILPIYNPGGSAVIYAIWLMGL